MKNYSVYIPFAGSFIVDVTAETAAAAVEAAMESESFEIELANPSPNVVLDQFDIYKNLVRGNSFNGPLDKAYAEENDDEPDEDGEDE